MAENWRKSQGCDTDKLDSEYSESGGERGSKSLSLVFRGLGLGFGTRLIMAAMKIEFGVLISFDVHPNEKTKI